MTEISKVICYSLAFMCAGPILILANQHILRFLNFPYPLFLGSIGYVMFVCIMYVRFMYVCMFVCMYTCACMSMYLRINYSRISLLYPRSVGSSAIFSHSLAAVGYLKIENAVAIGSRSWFRRYLI